MAKGDDLLNILISISEMVNVVAKNLKKLLAILRKKKTTIKTES